MFPTFAQYSSESEARRGSGPTAGTPAEPGPVRPLRKQVSRACDWCRARRIKCDNGRPCRSCRQRGADCTNRGTDEARTLPQAMKEVDRLRLRVKELEAELEAYKRTGQPTGSGTIPTPSDTSVSASPDSNISQRQHSQNGPSQPAAVWQGIFTSTARSDRTAYYGPSSSFYFVSRIGAFLGKSLQKPYADDSMQPRGINRTIVNPVTAAEVEGHTNPGSSTPKASMSRTQEEYFISLFWDAYHCLLPILDEADFRQHYDSLWATPGAYRKQSALVDIVIALCLQYGSTFMPGETNASGRDASHYDATIAGRAYYRRCQALLTVDLECPSLATVQTHLYSLVYLCCASFQNMAHTLMAQAIRTAQIIGLHLEPPAEMPRAERELRKRVWWVLYTSESKTCTKLGRPHAVDESQMTVSFPADDLEAAGFNGARLGSYGPDVTWLTYSCQCQKLMRTTMDVYRGLYEKCGRAVAEKQLRCLYEDPKALESCAEYLAGRMPALQAWADEVPTGVKLKRRGGGEPFSLDKSPVEIETLAPTWLQVQRICLELIYHTQAINLYRPFMTFCSKATVYTPISDRLAAACVNHAIAHTLIMHKTVSETDLMSGWTEAFIWQWNATLTLIGFILAYPIHPATPTARKALDKAIDVCDIYGANFGVAASAAGIARDLTTKADMLIDRLRTGVTPGCDADTTATPAGTNGNVVGVDGVGDALAWLDPSQQDESFTGFMDWALTVDSFNSFEHFYDTNNMGDLSSFNF